MRRITLVAEIPDEDVAGDEVNAHGQFAYSIHAEGTDPDATAAVLLGGVLALVHTTVRQEMEAANPMGNADFMDETAALEARLMLLDMAVHLPGGDQSGIVTTV